MPMRYSLKANKTNSDKLGVVLAVLGALLMVALLIFVADANIKMATAVELAKGDVVNLSRVVANKAAVSAAILVQGFVAVVLLAAPLWLRPAAGKA